MKKSKLEEIWRTELTELLEEICDELKDYPTDECLLDSKAQYEVASSLLDNIEWEEVEHEYINDDIPIMTLEVSERDFCIAAARAANGGDFDKILALAGIRGCNGKNYRGFIYFRSEKIDLGTSH